MLDKKVLKMIDEKTKVISHPTTVTETVNAWVNGIPKPMFDVWRGHCIANYNDIYWAKIWSDHLKAQAYDVLLNSSVEKVESVKEEPEDEKEPITFGDGGEDVKKNGKQV